jgi:deazaflavin-dependent oxidoreductase (nitroreductase family)
MSDDGPRTMAMQGVANRVVRGLLATPLLSKLVGRQLITLYVVGRTSGKQYTVPVAFTSHEGQLLIGSPFGWGRNLRTGEPLEVRYRGQRRTADVVVVDDEAGVVQYYAVIARLNKTFASFNKLGYDTAGNPREDDLHRAWAEGARVFLLTLR